MCIYTCTPIKKSIPPLPATIPSTLPATTTWLTSQCSNTHPVSPATSTTRCSSNARRNAPLALAAGKASRTACIRRFPSPPEAARRAAASVVVVVGRGRVGPQNPLLGARRGGGRCCCCCCCCCCCFLCSCCCACCCLDGGGSNWEGAVAGAAAAAAAGAGLCVCVCMWVGVFWVLCLYVDVCFFGGFF